VNKESTGYLLQIASAYTPTAAESNTSQGFASGREVLLLWTIAVLLLILWLLGVVSSYTLGGFIHILLVLAIVAVLIRLIQGRSPVL
jgi:hypothetical protein